MLARIAIVVGLAFAAATTAAAETRVALVIGNGDYADLRPRLPNPPADATEIGKALGRLGFDVEVVTDAGKAVMEDATARLARKARSADVTLLFFAGHGIQDLGKNYLAPVDADLSDETDLRRRFVRLDDVLDDLAGAKGALILVLDACRDNAAVEALRAAVPKTRSASVSRGLAPVPRTDGLLVAFATQPTRVADDGAGKHSPFTEALLTHLGDADAEFRTVLTRVRVAVARATDNRQVPETTDSLLREIYLNPSPASAAVEIAPDILPAIRPTPAVAPPSVAVPPPVEAAPPPAQTTGCTRRPCGEALVVSAPLPRAMPPAPVVVAPKSGVDKSGSGIPGCTRRPCPIAY
jgi:uncharacterized caspase-like protein